MNAPERFRRLALGTLAAVVVLLASHQGEFFPFSILPMYSQGGKPWVRSLVRDVSAVESARWAEPVLHGEPFALDPVGIPQNDVAKLVGGFGETLEPEEARLLEKLFDAPRRSRSLLVYLASGALDGSGGMVVRYRPMFVMDARGARSVAEAVR